MDPHWFQRESGSGSWSDFWVTKLIFSKKLQIQIQILPQNGISESVWSDGVLQAVQGAFRFGARVQGAGLQLCRQATGSWRGKGEQNWKSINQPQFQKIFFFSLLLSSWFCYSQCCWSGSGIWCIFSWIPDPRSGMGKKSGSGSGIWIRDEQPGSYFRELGNLFWGKILQFFDADPGSGMEKFSSGCRDKHPGSATLVVASMDKWILKDNL